MIEQKSKFKQTEIGMIPEDWEEKELGEEIELVYGKGLSEKKRIVGEYPVFGSNGIIGFHSEALVKGPGIIIGRKGSVGEVKFSRKDFWPIDTTYYVKLKKQGNISFWYYFLMNLGLNKLNSHSAVPGLNRDQVYQIVRKIPPLQEQSAIAKILSDLDSKIELNQQMNKTLEAIGQAIFKHWFVDFEFPNEKGEPYKSSGGEMVFNEELGKEIPRGWGISKLGQFLNITKGCSYKSDDLKKSNSALVTLKSINRNGGFNQEGYKEFIGNYKEEQVVKDGEIIVAQTDLTQNAEVIGTPAIINSLNRYDKLIASLDLQVIRIKDKLNTGFLYFLLKTDIFHNHALSYTNGTTVLHLNKNAVPDFGFILPDEVTLNQFGQISNKIIERKNRNEYEIFILSQIRDLLLPKLMSGKIRVPVEAKT